MTDELAKRINELEADVEILASNWVQTERELEEAKEDIKRLIHAAFCAGVRYMNGNRELKPYELIEARKYTDHQSKLGVMQ